MARGVMSRRPTSWRTARIGAQPGDIWRRRDLPRDGKARCWCRCRRRVGDGLAPAAGVSLDGHLVSRGWVCVSLNYRVSPLHTWRRTSST
ncbi:carboxylesterase domain protein [Mycobacterium kansasii]|uniref:Carboxylesterase domain protein n=1 Tax=Mycobacterium kansasii TaxID=1768 RepID=A0A1V3WA14_MYCKA|nr:carboxylesterase domain protein [Mycobacterium kansasii]